MKVIAILLTVCLALTSATYYNNYLYGGYGLSNYKYYNEVCTTEVYTTTTDTSTLARAIIYTHLNSHLTMEDTK
ncbi:hypothetical protein EB796_020868 [Bugula neritina]|uniref:Uncharacterized protein n=1 Tax=Bugula neritina TaxID=10212 RepID=A0A7J7J587_BUGNE|nr:hypothetical protein EB796_020868 [Bugula neritina]